jgi:hypothetical protein
VLAGGAHLEAPSAVAPRASVAQVGVEPRAAERLSGATLLPAALRRAEEVQSAVVNLSAAHLRRVEQRSIPDPRSMAFNGPIRRVRLCRRTGQAF